MAEKISPEEKKVDTVDVYDDSVAEVAVAKAREAKERALETAGMTPVEVAKWDKEKKLMDQAEKAQWDYQQRVEEERKNSDEQRSDGLKEPFVGPEPFAQREEVTTTAKTESQTQKQREEHTQAIKWVKPERPFETGKSSEGKPSFEDKKKHLTERIKELDAAIALKAEKLAEKIGEAYNKLPMKYKFAIGATLAGGMALTWPVSTVAGMAFGGVIGLQRAAGMFGMFVNFEKKLLDAHASKLAGAKMTGIFGRLARESEGGNKNEAAALAMAYTFGLSSAIGYGVKTAADWLADLYYDTNITEEVSAQPKAPKTTIVPAKPSVPVPSVELSAESAERLSKYGITGSSSPEQIATEQMTPNESREALRTAVNGIMQLTEEPSSFEMPKHADFSIHEDDTTISPYDVTPTDQLGEDDMLSTAEKVEEQTADTPETSSETIADTEPSVSPTETQETVTNSFGLDIPMTESHLYEGEGGRSYVLGGTTADHAKTIREFFAVPENAKKILYTPPVAGDSHVIGWIKSSEGAIMSTGPLEAEEKNWFGMRKYVEKIDTNWLRRLVK